MSVYSEKTGDIVVIHINQDIDLEQVPVLQNEFAKTIEAKPKVLILDFEGSDYICSSGIGLIAKNYKSSQLFGLKFALSSMSPRITKLITVVCFDRIMSIHPNLPAALDFHKKS